MARKDYGVNDELVYLLLDGFTLLPIETSRILKGPVLFP